MQAGQRPRQEEEKLQKETKQEPWAKWDCSGGDREGCSTLFHDHIFWQVVQEKKISTKINYDVLKNLTMGATGGTNCRMGSSSDSTMATLSPKKEPPAGEEKVPFAFHK